MSQGKENYILLRELYFSYSLLLSLESPSISSLLFSFILDSKLGERKEKYKTQKSSFPHPIPVLLSFYFLGMREDF